MLRNKALTCIFGLLPFHSLCLNSKYKPVETMMCSVIFEQIILGEPDMLSFQVQDALNEVHDDNEHRTQYYHNADW